MECCPGPETTWWTLRGLFPSGCLPGLQVVGVGVFLTVDCAGVQQKRRSQNHAHGASRCFSVCSLSLCVCVCLVDVVFCCVFAIVLMVVGMNACSFFGDD